jgi:hypothetical protein
MMRLLYHSVEISYKIPQKSAKGKEAQFVPFACGAIPQSGIAL